MLTIQSCPTIIQRNPTMTGSEHLSMDMIKQRPKDWHIGDRVGEVPVPKQALRTQILSSMEFPQVQDLSPTLLAFFWSWSGTDALEEVQEVQAPGPAMHGLAEYVNLLGLPPRSSTTAWISLQDDEHSPALLHGVLCHFPHHSLP